MPVELKPAHRVRRRVAGALAGAMLAAMCLAPIVGASNATLRKSLNSWSRTIGIDAHSVALAATNRHPLRMVASSRRLGADALKGRTALRAQHASTTKGRTAKLLAIAAFTDYAIAGRLWMASGQDRVQGNKAAAARDARSAAVRARAGNRLLVRAGKLLH
jgi:hypothetical protein